MPVRDSAHKTFAYKIYGLAKSIAELLRALLHLTYVDLHIFPRHTIRPRADPVWASHAYWCLSFDRGLRQVNIS